MAQGGKPRGHAPAKGRGVIKCAQCGEPTRDHSMLRLCPELVEILGTTRLTAPSPHKTKNEREKTGEL